MRSEYEACASRLGLKDVTGPDGIDQLLTASTGDDSDSQSRVASLLPLVDRVNAECGVIWQRGSEEAAGLAIVVVRERHADLFDAQIDHYQGLLETVLSDKEFLSFISTGR